MVNESLDDSAAVQFSASELSVNHMPFPAVEIISSTVR